jgi:hypothetical protein
MPSNIHNSCNKQRRFYKPRRNREGIFAIKHKSRFMLNELRLPPSMLSGKTKRT